MVTTPTYLERFADRRLAELLAAFPAVMLNGPRAAGKTTTARRHAVEVVRLDQPAQAGAFRADPDAALRDRPEPILLDEWQEVPGVLGAVKRSVDDDPRPGRFILTGSVRAEVEADLWPGTGRLIRLRMYGLTERELHASGPRSDQPTFLDRLLRTDPAEFARPPVPLDLRDYVSLAVRGAFPAVAINPQRSTFEWIDSYVEQLITRDSRQIARLDELKLDRYFEVLAASSAGLPEHKTLYDAAGINRRTADTYDALLEALYITERVPAWSGNQLSTLTHTPKRYVIDSALMAAALDASAETVIADDDLLGRTLDTFVAAQLRSEVAAFEGRTRVLHARTKGGREEVDLVIERAGRRVFGLEIKATASPTRSDAKHLLWLREKIGDRFAAGAVLHTGPDAFELADRVLAVPISAFWS